MFKKHVQKKLENYVQRYFRDHHPTLVVVVGSVGKTTTKTAIAQVLAKHYRVQMEPQNHNTELSVPLAIMGIKYPPMELVHKWTTWFRVFRAMRKRIKAPQGVDVIVQELGTDKPGDLAVFARYLKPDIAVVTAISPEHMENFPNGLVDVAKEELSIAAVSKMTIVNHDDVDASFAPFVQSGSISDYGIEGGEYGLDIVGGTPLGGYQVNLRAPGLSGASTVLHLVGAHNLKAACAAMTVGLKLGVPLNEVVQAMSEIRPVAGRMNPLPGRRNSTIIDDSYNSSPIAALAAIDTLYQIDTPQRIAVLGSMNELGAFSPQAHEQVGLACDPMMLDWVVTIGREAEQFLAPAAKRRGNQVMSFRDPISAGTFASQQLRDNAVVLVKGSQNNVFAEEAVKVMLRNVDDKDKLVRQSPYWMQKKHDWFIKLNNGSQDFDHE